MKFVDEARIEVHAGKGGQWGSPLFVIALPRPLA
jgi:GTPase involved in cell partitioning and DNA repair